MTRLRMLIVRFLSMFQTRRLERELETEIESHLAMQADDHQGQGMAPIDARPAAHRSFGGVEQMKEQYRELRGISLVETVVQDLRHGARMLLKNPGFTLVAVLSLAIGVGANVATFSFADAFLLRPLSVARPAELVKVGSFNVATGAGGNQLRASYRDYVDLRDQNHSFDGLAATAISQMQLAERPEATPEVLTGMLVSGNYFTVVGVEPELGRAFRTDEDEAPGRDAVIVLEHAFWERKFAADPDVIGRRARLNGVELTVIGVMPERFTSTDVFVRPEFYVPLMMWPALNTAQGAADPLALEARDRRSLTVWGRLRDGVSVEQANADVGAIGAALVRAYPVTNENQRTVVRTDWQDRLQSSGMLAPAVAMLMTLAAVVLLVACANVAGLLASRAPVRASEMALRLAIGAGRGRVIRQLFTENLLLAVGGGLAGVGVGYLGVVLWRQIQFASDLPIEFVFQIDRRALMVSMAVAIFSVFLFGLGPAFQTTRTGLARTVRQSGRGTAARRPWGRTLLVVAQVALSLVLIAVAGFMYASFLRQLTDGPGYRTDGLLEMAFNPSLSRYSADESARFYDRLVEDARQVAGVESATLASFVRMYGGGGMTDIRPEGYQFPPGTEAAVVTTNHVDESYFDTMGMRLVRGRAFRDTDTAAAPPVAIVNEVLAEQYWAGQDPLGKRFRIDGDQGPWVEVVGVAQTGQYSSLSETPMPFLYLPFAQRPRAQMMLIARSAADPLALVEPLRGVVRALDPNLAVGTARTMEDIYRDGAVGTVRVVVRAVAAMGIMGVVLAFVGLYGLVASGVSQRTREIGIRMAIGASEQTVLRMVLIQGLRVAGIGLVVGLLMTVGASRMMLAAFPGGGGAGRGLFEYVRVTMVVLVITGLAAYLPARRAARIQPIRALRYD